jgi:hypothetical protein
VATYTKLTGQTISGQSGTGGNSYNPNYPIQSEIWAVAGNHGKIQQQVAPSSGIVSGITFGAFATWLGITFDQFISELIAEIGTQTTPASSIKQTDQSPITASTALSLTTAVYVTYQ